MAACSSTFRALNDLQFRIPTTRSLDDLPGPKGLPWLGNLHQLDVTKVHLILEDWASSVRLDLPVPDGVDRLVVVTTDFSHDRGGSASKTRSIPPRRSKMDVILSEIGIRGVFNAEGEAWRPQRKLSVAALSQRNLRQLYPSIRTVAERMKIAVGKVGSARRRARCRRGTETIHRRRHHADRVRI